MGWKSPLTPVLQACIPLLDLQNIFFNQLFYWLRNDAFFLLTSPLLLAWHSSPLAVFFPYGLAGKESACNAGDMGSIAWIEKIPWRGERLPTPVFRPGEFHGLYSPWGGKESETTERLSRSSFPCLVTIYSKLSLGTEKISFRYISSFILPLFLYHCS